MTLGRSEPTKKVASLLITCNNHLLLQNHISHQLTSDVGLDAGQAGVEVLRVVHVVHREGDRVKADEHEQHNSKQLPCLHSFVYFTRCH